MLFKTRHNFGWEKSVVHINTNDVDYESLTNSSSSSNLVGIEFLALPINLTDNIANLNFSFPIHIRYHYADFDSCKYNGLNASSDTNIDDNKYLLLTMNAPSVFFRFSDGNGYCYKYHKSKIYFDITKLGKVGNFKEYSMCWKNRENYKFIPIENSSQINNIIFKIPISDVKDILPAIVITSVLLAITTFFILLISIFKKGRY